ncbi:hypothetical protein HSR122_1371 [Halapricum desulfuricans]|uniref:Uncharacterized protein n=1 Tax=Halapricum desulfuricans TaxID=2841257 RepID=A0A897N903_9EURY|nr:hypothetical protein HSR122_1371 [Halapricum desulfuricans]
MCGRELREPRREVVPAVIRGVDLQIRLAFLDRTRPLSRRIGHRGGQCV